MAIVVGTANVVSWAAGLEAAPAPNEIIDTLGLSLALPLVFSALAALIVSRQPGKPDRLAADDLRPGKRVAPQGAP